MGLIPRSDGTSEVLALSMAEIKLHLRITHELEDGDLELRAWAAQRAIAAEIGPIVASDWIWTLDAFRCGHYLALPAFQTGAVTAVYCQTAAGQQVPFADYVADVASCPGRIFLATGKAWPVGEFRRGAAVVIHLNLGWAPEAVPAPIKAALLLELGHLYANRESVVESAAIPRELPRGVNSLIAPYRINGAGWLPEDLA
jgi:uncharacterized phiE125 gp8 family phage protein